MYPIKVAVGKKRTNVFFPINGEVSQGRISVRKDSVSFD